MMWPRVCQIDPTASHGRRGGGNRWSFAITAHGSQCMTLEDFTIFEWGKMDTTAGCCRLRVVSGAL